MLLVFPMFFASVFWAIRYLTFNRRIIHCGIWEDLWNVHLSLSVACIVGAHTFMLQGVGNKLLDCFGETPGNTQAFVCAMLCFLFVQILLFSICVILWRQVEHCYQQCAPGTSPSVGHRISIGLRVVLVHCLTIGLLVSLVDLLFGKIAS